MKLALVWNLIITLVCAIPLQAARPNSDSTAPSSLWDLAQSRAQTHRFSTLFTAHDVKDHLSRTNDLETALDWCKRTAITKVYLEAFRDGYKADRAALQQAKETFQTAGFKVSGCVTTTQVGKKSTHWNGIACYTDLPTQSPVAIHLRIHRELVR